ncbi:hypothetical protein ABI59_15435 [Acidobacteria bacterium Mor1]|nr:hypothetical protein ABI59_15435 [Acidobacteria bacterium Mor1]
MASPRIAPMLLLAVLVLTPASAVEIERQLIDVPYLELPLVATERLDYPSLEAQVAFGRVHLGEPVQRRHAGTCPGSGSSGDGAYYYEIPVEVSGGVLVVRDATGAALHAARIEDMRTTERFGLDGCAFNDPAILRSAYQDQRESWTRSLREAAGNHYVKTAHEVIDRAMFAESGTEQVPCNRFDDRTHDYGELNDASRLAVLGYGALRNGDAVAGRQRLLDAIGRWEQALGQRRLEEDSARINRRVAARLYENIGAAMLVLGEYESSIWHLEKASRLEQTPERFDHHGARELLLRAQSRRVRSGQQAAGDRTAALQGIERAREYRGRIPVKLVPDSLARLEAEYSALADERASRQTAVSR